jgi:benzoyl-CoA 2,3-dioxygenase component B
MRQHDTDDVRAFGAIDLPTLQRFLNLHYSLSLDLFGQEISTNAANYYTMGLKGRFDEAAIADDHRLEGEVYQLPTLDGGAIGSVEAPALTALNERLRDAYVNDCARGVARWNKVIEKHGIDFALTLPHRAFHRGIGVFAHVNATPEGRIIDAAEWSRGAAQWLPTDADRAHVQSLMSGAVVEPGRMASWIAPPARGIDGRPADFQYVRFA